MHFTCRYKANLVKMLMSEKGEQSTLELPSTFHSETEEVGTVTLLRLLAATILGTGSALQNAIEGVSFIHSEETVNSPV